MSSLCCTQMPGKLCIVIHLKYLYLCFARWASRGFSDAGRELSCRRQDGEIAKFLLRVTWTLCCRSGHLAKPRAGVPPVATAGAGARASISGVTCVDPWAASCVSPVPVLSACVHGDTCKLLACVVSLILLLSVIVHSHGKHGKLRPVTSRNKVGCS